MTALEPNLRRTWLFGPGADAQAHEAMAAMAAIGADGLWLEVPTCRNAKRLLQRARRLAGLGANAAGRA